LWVHGIKQVKQVRKAINPAVMEVSPDADAWTTELRIETPQESPRDTMQRLETDPSPVWVSGVEEL